MKNEKIVDKYRFQLKDLLGKGSYGSVFRGIDTETNSVIAIKMLQKLQINSDPYLLQGLMSEIKIMKKLKSEHVVQLLDVLETPNNYYIIQDFCDGGDLSGYLKNHNKLTESEALHIITDILTGFMELLRNGVIHRDLKPANILIHQGIYKLADFGFSKCMQNFSQDLLVSNVGTPLYMAPQILLRQRYRSKSDIWSIGFIYYECLVGRTPWHGNSVLELIHNIHNNSLRLDHLDISAESKDFLYRCLTINEDDRISWDQLYRHPLFKLSFQAYLQDNKKLEFRAEFIINQLRERVASGKSNMIELYLKHNIGTELNFTKFQNLLLEIDGSLNREEVEFVFNLLDVNKNNSIDFIEFQGWLQKNQFRISLREIPIEVKPEKKVLSPHVSPHVQPQVSSHVQASIKILHDLRAKILEKKISLVDLFKALDEDNNFVLNLEEFSMLIKKIEPSVSRLEVENLFTFFDLNKNNSIDFHEFKNAIEKY